MPTNLTQVLNDPGTPNVYVDPVQPSLQPYEDVVKAVESGVEVYNENKDAEALAGFESEMSEVKGPGLEWYTAQSTAMRDYATAQGRGDAAGVARAEAELNRIETGEVQGQLSPYAAKIRRDQVVAKWSNLRPRIATALRQMASTTHTGTPEMRLTTSEQATKYLTQQTDKLAETGVGREEAGQLVAINYRNSMMKAEVEASALMAQNAIVTIPTTSDAYGIVAPYQGTVTGFINQTANTTLGLIMASLRSGNALVQGPGDKQPRVVGHFRKMSDPLFDKENWRMYLEEQRSYMKSNIRGAMYAVMRNATSDGKNPFDPRLLPNSLVEDAEKEIDAVINQALSVVDSQNVAQRMSWLASAQKDQIAINNNEFMLHLFTPAQLALMDANPQMFDAAMAKIETFGRRIMKGHGQKEDPAQTKARALQLLDLDPSPSAGIAKRYLMTPGWLKTEVVTGLSQPAGSGVESTGDEDQVKSDNPEKRAQAIATMSVTSAVQLQSANPEDRALGLNSQLGVMGNNAIVDVISKNNDYVALLTTDPAEFGTKTGKKSTKLLVNAGFTFARSRITDAAVEGRYLEVTDPAKRRDKELPSIFRETYSHPDVGAQSGYYERAVNPDVERETAIVVGARSAYDVAVGVNRVYRVVLARDPALAEKMRTDIIFWWETYGQSPKELDPGNPQAYLDAQKKEGEAK